MMRAILLAAFLCGCSVDAPPDDEPLPLCPDLGCENAYCDLGGECVCPVDGENVPCRFETDGAK